MIQSTRPRRYSLIIQVQRSKLLEKTALGSPPPLKRRASMVFSSSQSKERTLLELSEEESETSSVTLECVDELPKELIVGGLNGEEVPVDIAGLKIGEERKVSVNDGLMLTLQAYDYFALNGVTRSQKMAPIKAATVDDLQKQLAAKKEEVKEEIEKYEQQIFQIQDENLRIEDELNEILENQQSLDEKIKPLEDEINAVRSEEAKKNAVTADLQEQLTSLEDRLRTETEKLESLQKTKGSTDLIIKILKEEIENEKVKKQQFLKQKLDRENEYQDLEKKLDELKLFINQNLKGAVDQVAFLEKKMKVIDAEHDEKLSELNKEAKIVDEECNRLTGECNRDLSKLLTTQSTNYNKISKVPTEIIEESFRLRTAIHLKKMNQDFLLKEIELLMKNPDLIEKAEAVNHLSAEQFMIRKTKAECELIEDMKSLLTDFTLSKETFMEPDQEVISEELGKQVTQSSQQALDKVSYNHLDPKLLMEYVHMSKLAEIHETMVEDLEHQVRTIAEQTGENVEKILSVLDENPFDDSQDSWIQNPDHKILPLENFLMKKPNYQTKEMEQERLHVKQNVLTQWKIEQERLHGKHKQNVNVQLNEISKL